MLMDTMPTRKEKNYARIRRILQNAGQMPRTDFNRKHGIHTQMSVPEFDEAIDALISEGVVGRFFDWVPGKVGRTPTIYKWLGEQVDTSGDVG